MFFFDIFASLFICVSQHECHMCVGRRGEVGGGGGHRCTCKISLIRMSSIWICVFCVCGFFFLNCQLLMVANTTLQCHRAATINCFNLFLLVTELKVCEKLVALDPGCID